MTNVFTRKSRYPRTTTLLDFRSIPETPVRTDFRVHSPTRRGNPHPVGLTHQNIPSVPAYLIWHPNLAHKAVRYPEMVNHICHVNFCCKHRNKFDYVKKSGHLPDIRYTETTVARASYIDPARFPELAPDYKASPFGYKKPEAVKGIVPNLIVPAYLPVIQK